MGIRLNKAIRELNIGIQTAVEYLRNHHIGKLKDDITPASKITDAQYDALVKKFREYKLIKNTNKYSNQYKGLTKKERFENRIKQILTKLFYTRQTIDSIVEYLEQHRSDFNADTESWIRNSINGEENLNYYKERMSKAFDNYRDVEEDMAGMDPANGDGTIQDRVKTFKDDLMNYIKIQKKHQYRKKAQKEIKTKDDETVFDTLKKKEWILDWNCVMFKRGSVVIFSRSNLGFSFKPTEVSAPHSLESFNYLKKYLNERLPPVRCFIVGKKIVVADKINFSNAIQQFQTASRQSAIKVGSGNSGKNSPLHPMSFSQALSKANQMKPEDFQKYKSQYIDYLVTLQSKEHNVIPCVERLAHSNSDSSEYAFMFSIECRSGKVLIVHENVNPDRSTLLFLVKNESFNKSIREIYNFLQGAEINKRSSLRDKSIEIENAGILIYRSINHDDLYSWKQTISTYKNYR